MSLGLLMISTPGNRHTSAMMAVSMRAKGFLIVMLLLVGVLLEAIPPQFYVAPGSNMILQCELGVRRLSKAAEKS